MKEADLALITRLQQGDQSAFDTLVRQHQKALFRLAYRMTRNADDAKDISQEAFLRAYRGLEAFDGRSSLENRQGNPPQSPPQLLWRLRDFEPLEELPKACRSWGSLQLLKLRGRQSRSIEALID